MKTAHELRKLDGPNDARLYRLSHPVRYGNGGDRTRTVIVSAAVVPFMGPETYIFPTNDEGDVLDWGELEGSFRGGLDHEAALRGAGYTLMVPGAEVGQ